MPTRSTYEGYTNERGTNQRETTPDDIWRTTVLVPVVYGGCQVYERGESNTSAAEKSYTASVMATLVRITILATVHYESREDLAPGSTQFSGVLVLVRYHYRYTGRTNERLDLHSISLIRYTVSQKGKDDVSYQHEV